MLLGADRLHRFMNLIVGFSVPRSEVRSWSVEKRKIAFSYVQYIHLAANDNVVKKVKRPRWWKEEWSKWKSR